MNAREARRYLAQQEKLAKKLELKQLELELIKARKEAKIELEKAKTEEMRARNEVLIERWREAKQTPKAPKLNKREWNQYQSRIEQNKSDFLDDLLKEVGLTKNDSGEWTKSE